MRRKNYLNPIQVRVNETIHESMNNIFADKEYCSKKNILNKSEFIRSAIISKCKDYELENYNQRITA